MSISVGGIASGMDIDGIVSQLMAVEQRPILDMQRKIAQEEAKQAAYQDLNARLASLRTAVRKLDSEDLFAARDVSVSDDSILSVSDSDSAPPGNHEVEVIQLATAHRIAAQGFSDTEGVGAPGGLFRFKIGEGEEQSVELDSDMTLRQFADTINALGSDLQAEIVRDGTPTNPYRLVLTSKQEGEVGRIEILQNDSHLDLSNPNIEAATADESNSEDYTGTVSSSGSYTGTDNSSFLVEIVQEGAADGTARFRFSADGGLNWDDNGGAGYGVSSGGAIALSDGVEINFTDSGTLRSGDTFRIDAFQPELDSPQDALIKVNGIQIRQSSNTIDEVFEGLTLNLKSADPGTRVKIAVTQETGNVESSLNGFIGAYNSAIGFLNSQFAFDPESNQSAPILNGDSAARQIQRILRDSISKRIEGLTGDTLSALTELGVNSNEESGLLSLNGNTLRERLNEDSSAVERLLTRYGESLPGSSGFSYLRRSAKSQPGTYQVEIIQARSRAQVEGGQAAEVLAVDETLSLDFQLHAQDLGVPPVHLDIQLFAGDSADQQISRLSQAFQDSELALEAFLDNDGNINIRAQEFGADYALTLSSDRAAGPGSSGIGLIDIENQGNDLEGRIGGRPARVLDGNHLKGASGFDTEDIELIIEDGSQGNLGSVRIVDGFAEFLPDLIDGMTTGRGFLAARTEGVNSRVEDLEARIGHYAQRNAKVEERLRKQFTRMEIELGKLQSLGDYVSQQLQMLQNNNKK